MENFDAFVRKFNPESSKIHVALLEELRNCKMKEDFPKDAGMSAIDLGKLELDPLPFLLGSTLFVRDFYPRFLTEIRKSLITTVVGNSGKIYAFPIYFLSLISAFIIFLFRSREIYVSILHFCENDKSSIVWTAEPRFLWFY